MSSRAIRPICISLALLLLLDRALLAEPGDDWKFERLWLRGGTDYQGLLLSRNEHEWEFAEIVRPRGRPMYAIVRAISPKDVSQYNELEPNDRSRLQDRFNLFRNRALIEAGRMENLALRDLERDGHSYRVYDGFWFTFYSTADERTTRRAIVRIEQMFRAFRQVLPPRIKETARFSIYLYGTLGDYQTALQRYDIDSSYPAFFLPQHNAIIAGTDLDRFAEERAVAAAQNEQVRKQMRSLASKHEESLARVASEMKSKNFPAGEIQAEVRRRRGAWKQEEEDFDKQIQDAEHKNELQFREVSQKMFERLGHEAFHAYLDNYVYPHDQYSLPRWLNEGLAQVFEHAQLDGDTLRVDAPATDLLAQLQVDLRSKNPLKLAELLAGGEQAMADHSDRDNVKRYYLYSWGLAYYLVFMRDGLSKKPFDEYVSRNAAKSSPIERLERWTGQDLRTFEAQWRKKMLELR